MKRRMIREYCVVLFIALALSSIFFYFIADRVLYSNTRKDMLYTLNILNSFMEQSDNNIEMLKQEEEVLAAGNKRFTIIDTQGTVCMDTDVSETEKLDNHLKRKEVKQAMKSGKGYCIRYSQTLKTKMLYVARMSGDQQYILRLAIPLTSSKTVIFMIIPFILLSAAVSFAIALLFAEHFAKSITTPFSSIAYNLKKNISSVEKNTILHFEEYPYEELNTIASALEEMSETQQEYIKKLEKERQIRQEFFANASHELKTPITSIKGYSELILAGMAENKQQIQEFSGRIRKEAENMTELINDILMISRLETKEITVVFSEVSVQKVWDNLYEQFCPLAAKYEVDVQCSCEYVWFYGYENHIRELLNNLVTNAIKYNRPNGHVYVTITKEGKKLNIIVEDTGIGIPKDSIDRVFERFYRVDKGRSKKAAGTGLGLSIVKHIVGYYEGNIELKSRVDIGTIVTVELPEKNREEI